MFDSLFLNICFYIFIGMAVLIVVFGLIGLIARKIAIRRGRDVSNVVSPLARFKRKEKR